MSARPRAVQATRLSSRNRFTSLDDLIGSVHARLSLKMQIVEERLLDRDGDTLRPVDVEAISLAMDSMSEDIALLAHARSLSPHPFEQPAVAADLNFLQQRPEEARFLREHARLLRHRCGWVRERECVR